MDLSPASKMSASALGSLSAAMMRDSVRSCRLLQRCSATRLNSWLELSVSRLPGITARSAPSAERVFGSDAESKRRLPTGVGLLAARVTRTGVPECRLRPLKMLETSGDWEGGGDAQGSDRLLQAAAPTFRTSMERRTRASSEATRRQPSIEEGRAPAFRRRDCAKTAAHAWNGVHGGLAVAEQPHSVAAGAVAAGFVCDGRGLKLPERLPPLSRVGGGAGSGPFARTSPPLKVPLVVK